MANGKIKMTCADTEKKIKHFVGDLLNEDDYEAFVGHLESCPNCKKHVRAMGSFSNQLWELVDIEIPSDLDSTILFQLKQPEPETGKPKSAKSKKLVFAVSILIVGLIGYFGWNKFIKAPEPSPVTGDAAVVVDATAGDDAVIVTAQITKGKKPISDVQAEQLFGQLQQMAESLAPIATDMNDKKDLKKTDSKGQETSSSDKSQGSDKAAMSDSYPIHWHIPYYEEAKLKQLLNTIKGLEINLDYEDQDFLVFTTTGEKIKLLSDGIQFTDKLQLDIPDFIAQGLFSDMEIPTSIYFIRQGSLFSETLDMPTNQKRNSLVSFEQRVSSNYNYFDWHILLIYSQQKTLLDVIRSGGGTIRYTSDEVVIFSVPGIGMESLVDEIQNMGGVFAEKVS